MPEILKKIFKSIWLQLAVVIVISLFAAAYFTDGGVFRDVRVLIWGTLWSATIWVTQWFGNGFLTNFLDKRISWIEKPLKRLFLGVVVQSAYSTLAILIVCGVFEWLIGGGINDFWNWALVTAGIAIKISLFITGVFTAIAFFSNWKSKEAEAERLRAEMMTYKYESLRNQINPHFLFNSFNVLSEMVYEDQNLAVQFISKLSNVYRYVLDSRNRELVSLDEEVKFVQTYVFLLSSRFGEALQVELNVEDVESGYVVPMSLQLLIENAVKHNEVSASNPLIVNVFSDGDRLLVTNKILRKQVGENSKGIGLENITSRYAYFTDDEVKIEETDIFKVSLPILKQDESSNN